MSEEWGPWIEHDGKGRPNLDGYVRQVEYADGEVVCLDGPEGWWTCDIPYLGPRFSSSWDWSSEGDFVPAIRYRIRKPRALSQLQEMIRDLEGEPA